MITAPTEDQRYVSKLKQSKNKSQDMSESEEYDAALGSKLADIRNYYFKVIPFPWPDRPYAHVGYSCPSVGEITGDTGHWIHTIHESTNNKIHIAGEHATKYYFAGFMEGALRSGVRAANNIIDIYSEHRKIPRFTLTQLKQIVQQKKLSNSQKLVAKLKQVDIKQVALKQEITNPSAEDKIDTTDKTEVKTEIKVEDNSTVKIVTNKEASNESK